MSWSRFVKVLGLLLAYSTTKIPHQKREGRLTLRLAENPSPAFWTWMNVDWLWFLWHSLGGCNKYTPEKKSDLLNSAQTNHISEIYSAGYPSNDARGIALLRDSVKSTSTFKKILSAFCVSLQSFFFKETNKFPLIILLLYSCLHFSIIFSAQPNNEDNMPNRWSQTIFSVTCFNIRFQLARIYRLKSQRTFAYSALFGI